MAGPVGSTFVPQAQYNFAEILVPSLLQLMRERGERERFWANYELQQRELKALNELRRAQAQRNLAEAARTEELSPLERKQLEQQIQQQGDLFPLIMQGHQETIRQLKNQNLLAEATWLYDVQQAQAGAALAQQEVERGEQFNRVYGDLLQQNLRSLELANTKQAISLQYLPDWLRIQLGIGAENLRQAYTINKYLPDQLRAQTGILQNQKRISDVDAEYARQFADQRFRQGELNIQQQQFFLNQAERDAYLEENARRWMQQEFGFSHEMPLEMYNRYASIVSSVNMLNQIAGDRPMTIGELLGFWGTPYPLIPFVYDAYFSNNRTQGAWGNIGEMQRNAYKKMTRADAYNKTYDFPLNEGSVKLFNNQRTGLLAPSLLKNYPTWRRPGEWEFSVTGK